MPSPSWLGFRGVFFALFFFWVSPSRALWSLSPHPLSFGPGCWPLFFFFFSLCATPRHSWLGFAAGGGGRSPPLLAGVGWRRWCVVCGVLVGLWLVCGVVGPSPLVAVVLVCYSPPLLAGFRCRWWWAIPATPGWGPLAAVVCGVWCVVCGVWRWCVGGAVAGVWCGWSLATPGGGSCVLLPATPGWVSLPVVVGGPRHSWLGSAGGGGVWCVVCWWGCGWCVVWLVPRHSWRWFLCATPRHSWLGFAAGGGGRSPPLLAGVRWRRWCVVCGVWCVVCGGGVLVGLWLVCGVVGPSPLLAGVPVCYSPPLLAGFRCRWWWAVPATAGWGPPAAVVCGVSCVAVVCWWGCGWCVVWLVPRHSWRRFLCATPRHSWLGFAAGGGGRSPPLPAGVRWRRWCVVCGVLVGLWLVCGVVGPSPLLALVPVCYSCHSWLGFAAGGGGRSPPLLAGVLWRRWCVVCGVWCVVCGGGVLVGLWLVCGVVGPSPLLAGVPVCYSPPLLAGFRCRWWWAVPATPGWGPLAAVLCGVSFVVCGGGVLVGLWLVCGVFAPSPLLAEVPLCYSPPLLAGFRCRWWWAVPATPGWGPLAAVVCGVWCVACGGGVLVGLWLVCGVVGPSPLLAEVPVCYSPPLLAEFRCRWWWAVPATPGWGPLAAVVCGVWCVGGVVAGVWCGWSLASFGGGSCVLLPATPGWVSLPVLVGGPRHSWLGSSGGGGVWCVVCGVWCVVCGGGVLVGLWLLCGVVGPSPLLAGVPVCYSPPLLAGFRCRWWWAVPATPGWGPLAAVLCGVSFVVCGGGVLVELWLVWCVVGPSPLLAEVPLCYSPPLLAGFRCRWWWAVPATPGWGPLAAVVCGVWCVACGGGVLVGLWLVCGVVGPSPVLAEVPVCYSPPLLAGFRCRWWWAVPATPGWGPLAAVVCGVGAGVWRWCVGGVVAGVWCGWSLAVCVCPLVPFSLVLVCLLLCLAVFVASARCSVPCVVLCCVSRVAVPRCAAARCVARCCAVVCCVVLLRSVGAAARRAVPSGAPRRPGALCFAALRFAVFLRAVCVLSLRAGVRCCWPLCFVLCVSLGAVLCVPCPLRSVWCCASLCSCACVVLFVWCVLLRAPGAVVRCRVLRCFLWCAVLWCWVWWPVVVCWCRAVAPCCPFCFVGGVGLFLFPVCTVLCCAARRVVRFRLRLRCCWCLVLWRVPG